MSNYTTPTEESDHENEVISNFNFNTANLVVREHAAFFKTRITDVEKEKEAYSVRIELLKSIKDGHRLRARRNRFKVKLLKHKMKQCSYKDSVGRFKVSKELEMKKKNAYDGRVELFRMYTNLHSDVKANKDWLNVDMTDKCSLLYRRLF